MKGRLLSLVKDSASPVLPIPSPMDMYKENSETNWFIGNLTTEANWVPPALISSQEMHTELPVYST